MLLVASHGYRFESCRARRFLLGVPGYSTRSTVRTLLKLTVSVAVLLDSSISWSLLSGPLHEATPILDSRGLPVLRALTMGRPTGDNLGERRGNLWSHYLESISGNSPRSR